ncbi:hypothetical protein LTR62_007727 [Meristemomyces frigidus]|uniref:Uncharacterized protein n=1 Tax=Meristemomyces frigidus TaxID=1508187 RepID=A0AAN7TAT9_9PEZI|nr:hypothetical protein LTR62_007727 [Meristemomyces frigidus]
MAIMDLDKENRPPTGMVVDEKRKSTGPRHTLTPSRLRQKKQDQYFEPGVVGRKTGLTLPDKGIRDENGLEPIAGIFSPSPKRNADRTLTSSDMHMQESSAPEVDQTLHLRKTPKLPPPRASTPKHTNIGSPKRGSTGRQPHTTGKVVCSQDIPESSSPSKLVAHTQPPANRMLDFKEGVAARSIENQSPFKPKKSLRRSMAHQDPFASPERVKDGPALEHMVDAVKNAAEKAYLALVDETSSSQHAGDGWQPSASEDDGQAIDMSMESEMDMRASPSAQLSIQPSSAATAVEEKSPDSFTSKKRDRSTMEHEITKNASSSDLVSSNAIPSKAARRRTRIDFSGDVVVRRESREMSSIDHSSASHSSIPSNEVAAQPMAPPPANKSKSKSRMKGYAYVDAQTYAPAQPISTDAPRRMTIVLSPSRRAGNRGLSLGPSNNLNFRATTPFEDATATSRFGRPILPPLQYWANETRVWKNGECEGIIRAEEVVPSKPAKKRTKKRKTTHVNKLSAIEEEESDTESILADEWESDVGVISGTVASWDVPTQAGDPANPVKEDLAFAASSILTRDVPGSEFKYAKIMTLPFFGAGLVELPPEGFKRAKNSRKMQMVFFVHEGKVMVEIGGQEMEGEANGFAISKGGVWIVPRGLSGFGIISRPKGFLDQDSTSPCVDGSHDSQSQIAVAHRPYAPPTKSPDPEKTGRALFIATKMHKPGLAYARDFVLESGVSDLALSRQAVSSLEPARVAPHEAVEGRGTGRTQCTGPVVRRNNYSITNESRTKPAKIFFAQGCEVEGAA